MSSPLRNWFENQKQTRKFHPTWILLGIVTTVIVAGIIWGVAALFAEADYERMPSSGHGAVPTDIPAATIREPAPPRDDRPTIKVESATPTRTSSQSVRYAIKTPGVAAPDRA